MNARQLAMRDPAMAALMGLAVIGSQADFGSQFAGELDDDYGAEFGDEYGAEFGDDYGFDDYGAEFGAAPALARPNPQMALAALRMVQMKKARSAQRGRILEPNKGSAVKVERYSFTISQAITLGTAVALSVTGNPDTTIRPQRVSMNAPSPMFAFITEIKVANVSVSVGSGFEDAYNYNANGVGQMLDMPTLSPANRATVLGSYTGFVPTGFVGGTSSYFSVSLKGPASIVA